ncbi:MAG: hypothetical protein Q9222_003891 [Ikaeria aurantiellina]
MAGLYLIDERLCQWDLTRPCMGTLCWPDPVMQPDWALPHWSNQKDRSDYLPALAPSMEAFMIGHLTIREAEEKLWRQSLELNRLAGADPTVPRLQSQLSALSPLADHWEWSSLNFCMEKDSLNRAFRSLIETYAVALASDHDDVSLLFFPALQFLRDLNEAVELHWILPAPKVRTSRLKSQIRSLAKSFIDEASEALQRIDIQSSITSPTPALKEALAATAEYIDGLKSKPRASWLNRQFAQADGDRVLDTQLTLAGSIQASLSQLQEHAKETDRLRKKLQGQIQAFRRSLDNKGAIQMPLRKFVLRTPNALLEHPKSNINEWITSFTASLPIRCKGTVSSQNFPPELHTFCTIYGIGLTLSEIDSESFDDTPRMWVMERSAAIGRYESRTQTSALRVVLWQDEWWRSLGADGLADL